ncbi:MAG TPA: pantoate--beta-alanine ligase [Puia sp.]|nr:pantoate--beta-alanine ligase [Puia sp.]
MILFKKSGDLRQFLQQIPGKGMQVGWVPTMGALHPGHLSLLETARKENALSICSIFVNPTQFNVASDFEKYPITLEKDIKLLVAAKVDLLFLPDVDDIYPKGISGLEQYPLGYLETTLEGEFRPGHFQGVCQVMNRLLEIIAPGRLYMGQKDYQQCMVIQKLLELKQSGTILHTCSTRREPDGLAMSSRNMRLSESERKDAIGLYEALTYIQQHLHPGDLTALVGHAKSILLQRNFRIDYVEMADAVTLHPVKRWDSKEKLVALAAAFQGQVRLIDNMLLT